MQSTIWQLLASLSVKSSVSSDKDIDGTTSASGKGLPTHSGHATPARLYPRDDTLSRQSGRDGVT